MQEALISLVAMFYNSNGEETHEMETEFKAGDVVQLKSGGPKMTVESIDNYSYTAEPDLKAKCVWFEGTKQHDSLFALAALTKA